MSDHRPENSEPENVQAENVQAENGDAQRSEYEDIQAGRPDSASRESGPTGDDEPTRAFGGSRAEDGGSGAGAYGDGYGQQGGYGQSAYGRQGAGAWDTSAAVAAPERPRRRRTGLVSGFAALLAAALVGGAVGGAAGYYAGDQRVATSGVANSSNAQSASNSLTGPSAVPAVDAATASSVEAVAKSVAPTVVQITESNGQSGGTGSGSIVSSDGLILTNNHVVAAAANGGKLSVTFNDGTTVPATIVGRDSKLDVAVIRARTDRQLTPISFGDSSKIAVGQPVVAFGSPLGLSGTVTSGIISALRRPVSSTGEQTQPGVAPPTSTILALQTDAAINPGNSGGPLVNLNGQMIGMDSAIASLGASSGSQSGSIGLGFALPINTIKPIVKQLESNRAATHGYLGVQLAPSQQQVPGTGGGATIQQVDPNKPAGAAGLKAGDVITQVDGQPIPNAETLVATIRSMRPGEKVSVTYTRNGKANTTQVTLGSDAKVGQ